LLSMGGLPVRQDIPRRDKAAERTVASCGFAMRGLCPHPTLGYDYQNRVPLCHQVTNLKARLPIQDNASGGGVTISRSVIAMDPKPASAKVSEELGRGFRGFATESRRFETLMVTFPQVIRALRDRPDTDFVLHLRSIKAVRTARVASGDKPSIAAACPQDKPACSLRILKRHLLPFRNVCLRVINLVPLDVEGHVAVHIDIGRATDRQAVD